MVPTSKDEIVDALVGEWRIIANLCADFDDQQWASSTPVPGWSVQDNIAHIIGTEKLLAGDPVPDLDLGDPAHVHNEIGDTNERWVASMRSLSGAEVLAEFNTITERRAEALRAMTQQDFDQESWTPAGQANYGRFMVIRVFDCWTHEQDIRVALGLPGNLNGPAAELSLNEVRNAMGFIVGKRGEAPDGSRVEFNLTGAVDDHVIRVEVDGRAGLVDEFTGDAEPTIALSMPFELFMRLTAGRRTASSALDDGLIVLAGDTSAGAKIARNLTFTI